MAATLKVPLKETQRVKKILIAKELFNHDHSFSKDKKYTYIPIKKKSEVSKLFKYPIVDKDLKKIAKETDLKQALTKKLKKEELSQLKTAYDVIGTIAILEIDGILEPKAKVSRSR